MVTIIGAGIAGTTLAGALASHGNPATVYERHPASATCAFLVLDGRAHNALHHLGIHTEHLHQASHPLTGLEFTRANGETHTRPSDGHRLYFRPDLMQVLTDFAHTTNQPITE